jgi:arabinofuranosyltransferase
LRALGDAALGVLPFLAWSLFALVYYGSAVPNTAYAKLAHGTSRTEVIAQGVSYLWTTVTFDPPGTALAVLGIAAALRDGRRVMLACGVSVLLYVAYVVSVGGDFMAGRFTTPVLVAGAVLWLVSTWGDEHLELATRTTRRRAALVGLIAVLGVLPHDHVATPLARSLGLPIPAGPLPLHSTHWVTVEQGFYWEATALLEVARSSSPPPRHEWADRGRGMAAEGRRAPRAQHRLRGLRGCRRRHPGGPVRAVGRVPGAPPCGPQHRLARGALSARHSIRLPAVRGGWTLSHGRPGAL